MMQVVTTRRKKRWTISMQNTWTISFYNKTAKIQQQKKVAPSCEISPKPSRTFSQFSTQKRKWESKVFLPCSSTAYLAPFIKIAKQQSLVSNIFMFFFHSSLSRFQNQMHSRDLDTNLCISCVLVVLLLDHYFLLVRLTKPSRPIATYRDLSQGYKNQYQGSILNIASPPHPGIWQIGHQILLE